MGRFLVVGSFASCILFASCNGTQSDSQPNLGLRPAGSVVIEEALRQATPLGDMVDVDSSSRFTVQSFVVGGDELGPWLETKIRGEAADAMGALPVDIAIRCASSSETGGWQVSSTVSLGQEIPKGTFLDGTIALLLPDDGRYGDQIEICESPALIEVGTDGKFWFAIPEDVLAELNSRADAYNLTVPLDTLPVMIAESTTTAVESTTTEVANSEFYTVQPGDTLASIASAFGLGTGEILYANGLISSDEIFVGQKLIIPL
jgi:hypothetical protein